MDQRSRGDRSGEMRRDAHEVCFADRLNLQHLSDAADIGKGGAVPVDMVSFHEFVEVPPVAPLFACRQGHVYFLAQNRNIFVESLGANRVFDEERRELLNQFASADGVAQVKPLVEIDAPDRKSTRLNSSHIPLSRMPS